MVIVFSDILPVIGTLANLVIGTIAGLVTIASFIVPFISQHIQHSGNKEPEVKRRRNRVFRLILGFSAIGIAALITLIIYIAPPTSLADNNFKYPGKFLGATLISSLVWSPDSSQIATADKSGRIKIWDVSTGKALVTYQPPATDVSSLTWSPDGKYIAADIDGSLYILGVEPKMLQPVSIVDSFTLFLGSSVIAWSPDGSRIAVASQNSVYVWKTLAGHIETNQTPMIYSHHTKMVIALTWSPDGRFIASTSMDNTIQTWQPGKRNLPDLTIKYTSQGVQTCNSYTDPCMNYIAWSPNGHELALENNQGMLSVWDLRGHNLFTYRVEQRDPRYPAASSIAWSPDSQVIATGAYDPNNWGQGQIVIVDGGSHEQIASFSYQPLSFRQYALAWSPDQEYVAASYYFGGVIIFPSDEVDDRVAAQQQHSSSQLTPLAYSWLLLLVESIVVGPYIGIVILYKSIEKPGLSYISESWNQKILRQIKEIPSFIPSIIIIYISYINYSFILRLFIITFEIPFIVIVYLFSCAVGILIISPSVMQRYLYPLFLSIPNYYKAASFIKTGKNYAKQKQYHLAVSQYDQALLAQPKNASAYLMRGKAWLYLGEYQWALDDFNQAFHLKSPRMAFYEDRGNAHYKLKHYKQALEDFDQAIDVMPENSEKATLYFNRGYTHLWLKNVSQARVDFLRSARLNQTFLASAWMAIWTSLDKKRVDKERAEQLATQLKEIADRNPQMDTAHLCLGISLALRKNIKSALKEVEQAIAQSPQREGTYFWKGLLLAYYYQGQSHVDDVAKLIEQALQQGLPPALLTPVYWLEKDIPKLFTDHIQPLIRQYLE